MDKNKTIETWEDIIGYEGIYQISSHGRVKKLKRKWVGGNGGERVSEEKIMTPHYSKFGYNHQILIKNGVPKDLRVCRLVGIHFISNLENKPFVNHIDGNKANDHVDNIEWVTRSENDLHAYKTGLRTPRKGSENGTAITTEAVVLKIRKEYAGGNYIRLSQKYKLRPDHIGQIIRRDTWRHI